MEYSAKLQKEPSYWKIREDMDSRELRSTFPNYLRTRTYCRTASPSSQSLEWDTLEAITAVEFCSLVSKISKGFKL